MSHIKYFCHFTSIYLVSGWCRMTNIWTESLERVKLMKNQVFYFPPTFQTDLFWVMGNAYFFHIFWLLWVAVKIRRSNKFYRYFLKMNSDLEAKFMQLLMFLFGIGLSENATKLRTKILRQLLHKWDVIRFWKWHKLSRDILIYLYLVFGKKACQHLQFAYA